MPLISFSNSSHQPIRILFISHDASMFGAPRSLNALLAEFTRRTKWECKIVVRARPWILSEAFEQYGETFYFYKYRVSRPHIFSARELMKFMRGRISQSNLLLPLIEPLKQRYHVKTLRKLLAQWKPNLIYSNTAMNGDVIRALNLKAPVLVHVREMEWFLRTLDLKRLQAFRQDPQLYFAVSEAVKRNLMDNHGIDAGKIEIVPVGINPRIIRDNSQEITGQKIRERLGFGSNTVIVGTVGRVDRRKGSDLFVSVVAKVVKKLGSDRDIAFMWIGDGPDRRFVIQALRKQGIEDNFQMVGMQENPYPYINCIDILFTSSRDDPFPRVNLEAGLLGKPLVAFENSGGSKEFIGNDCGIALPSFDTDAAAESIIGLILNPGERESFGRCATRKVEKLYDINVIAQNARNLIAEHFGL